MSEATGNRLLARRWTPSATSSAGAGRDLQDPRQRRARNRRAPRHPGGDPGRRRHRGARRCAHPSRPGGGRCPMELTRPRPSWSTRRGSTRGSAYRSMVTIRLFEERVNELYRSGRCPAWRICTSARRRSPSASARPSGRTTTSPRPTAATGTAWPRAPTSAACSRSCWARRRATAAARAARCTSPTTQNGNLGANAIVGGSTGIATGAAFSASTAAPTRWRSASSARAPSARACSTR